MPPASPDELSLAESTLVGTLCDEFEQALRAGETAELANVLGDPRLTDQRGFVASGLFRELLKLDVWYRISGGEQPACDDYCRRFEDYREIILRLRLLFPLHQSIAGYPLLRMLGSGGMADTFLTRAGATQRIVAIKLLRTAAVAGRDDRARFRRELRSGELSHANIVKVFDADEADGRSFLLLELVRGQTLDDIVRDRGRLDVAQACELSRQAAAGLECAHAAGVIHRDVNPKNLMLDVTGTVKVIDFGLAKWLAEHPVDALTQAGLCLGTPGFMAPEQVLANGSVDVRSDVFGLGATLYFLLTGQRAIGGSKWNEFRDAMAEFKIRPLSELHPDIPSGLNDAIESMLARDPGQRMASMQAVQAALSPYCTECDLHSLLSEDFIATLDDVVEELSAAPATGKAPPPAGFRVTAGRKRRFWFALAAAVVLTASAALWWSHTRSPDPQQARPASPSPMDSVPTAPADEWGLTTPDSLFRMAVTPTAPLDAYLLTPRRILSEVTAVEFSPDGSQIAMGTKDGDFRLWTADHPGELRAMARHRGGVTAVRWNGNGSLLASASSDGTIHVFNDRGNRIISIDHETGIADIAWNPGADTLASIDREGSACLWDLNGRNLLRFKAERNYGSRILWIADGTGLITSGGENCVHFWGSSGKSTGQTEESPFGTHWLCQTPQRFLLSRADDPAGIGVWNPHRSRWSKLLLEKMAQTSAALSRDGMQLAYPCFDGTITVGTLERTDQDELNFVNAVNVPSTENAVCAWHPSNARLASAWRALAIWDLSRPNGAELAVEIKHHGPGAVRRVQSQPGGTSFAVCGDDGLFQIREFGGKLVAELSGRYNILEIAWSPDGTILASGSAQGVIRFHSPSGTEIAAFADDTSATVALAWHPSGTWLASNGNEKIRCHHPARGAGPVIASGGITISLCWSTDGGFLISGMARTAAVQAWDTAQEFHDFRSPPDNLPGSLRGHAMVLAVHPSQPLLAAGATYGTLILWRFSDGSWKPLKGERDGQLAIHEGSLQRAAWSANGQRLATGDNVGVVALWTTRGSFVGELRTRSPITALRWSPDDRWLAVGDAAGTLWVYDFERDHGFHWTGSLGRVESLDWSSDGRQLLVAAQAGALLRIDMVAQAMTSVLLFGGAGRFAELGAQGEFADGDREFLDEFRVNEPAPLPVRERPAQ